MDKVQVVDRKSDQAQFTGIEDDDTEKIINFVGDSLLNYNQWQWQQRKSQNHRMNFELDYTINERNFILFRPNVNIGSGSTNSLYDYETFTPSGVIHNLGETNSFSKNTSLSTSSTLLWRHSFDKQGRTLSVNFNYGWSQNKSNGDNYSYTLGVGLQPSSLTSITGTSKMLVQSQSPRWSFRVQSGVRNCSVNALSVSYLT